VCGRQVKMKSEKNRENIKMMRVLGLGDNVVDKYMHIMTMYPGGNALNFAVYARMFGVEAAFLGNFGDDKAAKHVYETVVGLGLDVSHCRFWEGEHGAARVSIVDGDRVFLGSNKGGISNQHPLSLTRMDLEYISKYDIIHTSIFSYIESQLPKLRQAARFISMDFSDSYAEEDLKQCCPYIDCACISCGEKMPAEQILALMKEIISYGCKHMVIATRGAKGAFVLVDGGVYQQSPCLVKAKDTMGAGDSFITCFLVSYVDGMRYGTDFPEGSGDAGVIAVKEYKDLVIQTSLHKAAVYAAQNCQRDGAFGFGKAFEE